MEDRIGTLAPGMKADIVLLSHDLARIPPAEVLHTQVLGTVLDGRFVYEGTGSGVNRTAEIPSHPGDACACLKFTRPVT